MVGNIERWGIVTRIIVFVLIVLGIVGAVNWQFLAGQREANAQKTITYEISKKEYSKNTTLLLALPQIRVEVEKLEENLKFLLRYLPDQISMPQLVEAVYQEGKDNNVRFDEFKPMPDKVEGQYYVVKPIAIKTKAEFINLISFVQNVAKLERIVNVQNIKLNSDKKIDLSGQSAQDQNMILTIEMELQTYIFSKEKVGGEGER